MPGPSSVIEIATREFFDRRETALVAYSLGDVVQSRLKAYGESRPMVMQELVRLALDGTSTSRLEVVQTMGATGQTRFVEPLVRLAWTEPNHHLRQAALNSLAKLVPQAEQPKQLAKARNLAEAVEIWTAWWEDRQSRRNPAPGLSVNR